MTRSLIIGANRGIGLELCRQLRARGDSVVATFRKSGQELEAIRGIEIHEAIDVTDADSVRALAQKLGVASIDLLVLVAGILSPMGLAEYDPEVVRRHFEVNALGTITTTVTLLPCVRDGGKVALLSSRMGSMTDNTSGGSYAYRMSKAALNSAGRSLGLDLAPRGIAVGILHPGWVKTAMTGGSGLIDAATSAEGLIARIDELSLETSGTFMHQNGDTLPW